MSFKNTKTCNEIIRGFFCWLRDSEKVIENIFNERDKLTDSEICKIVDYEIINPEKIEKFLIGYKDKDIQETIRTTYNRGKNSIYIEAVGKRGNKIVDTTITKGKKTKSQLERLSFALVSIMDYHRIKSSDGEARFRSFFRDRQDVVKKLKSKIEKIADEIGYKTDNVNIIPKSLNTMKEDIVNISIIRILAMNSYLADTDVFSTIDKRDSDQIIINLKNIYKARNIKEPTENFSF